MQTYYAHSTIRAKRGASGKLRPYLRTNVYSKPSFTKASKQANRRTSGKAKSIKQYHNLKTRHRFAITTAGGLAGAYAASRAKSPIGAMKARHGFKTAAGIAVALTAGKMARNRLRRVGYRRGFVAPGNRYVARSHGKQSVRSARRTRRNYKGQFAGSM